VGLKGVKRFHWCRV